MAAQPYTILSVGGSVIIPSAGFNLNFLKKFRALILAEVKKGRRFILVIGGGATARAYQAAGRGLKWPAVTLDWVGIAATKLNAEFVRLLFGNWAHDQIITNPGKKISADKSIIIAAGWKPGCSTDKDAVLLAKTHGAHQIINISNVDYVYESDPRKNPRAKKLPRLTWGQLQKIVGTAWRPGANVPFDPAAVRLAKSLKLKVYFVRGKRFNNLAAALRGARFIGTIVT